MTSDPWVFIEIEAEGWPRYIGPFTSRYMAERFMEGRAFTGSWVIAPMVAPLHVNHLGKP